MTAASETPTNEPVWKDDPSDRLTRGFQTIAQTRMKDMPFNHPRVHVEAVGFRHWQGCWFGVMVTPWSMNFILTEGDPSRWHIASEGGKLNYHFPAGVYDFISVKDKLLGEYQMCSLFSPLHEQIRDHEFAVMVAKAAIDEIMKDDTEPAELGQKLVPQVDPNEPTLAEKFDKAMNEKVSRRGLFARFRKDRGSKEGEAEAAPGQPSAKPAEPAEPTDPAASGPKDA